MQLRTVAYQQPQFLVTKIHRLAQSWHSHHSCDEWQSPTLASVWPQSGKTDQMCLTSRDSAHQMPSPTYSLELPLSSSRPGLPGTWRPPVSPQAHTATTPPAFSSAASWQTPGGRSTSMLSHKAGAYEPVPSPEPPGRSWCGGHWGKTLQGEQEQVPGHQPAFPGCLKSSTLPGSKVGLGTNPWDKVRKQSPGHRCWGSHSSAKEMGDPCLALPR